MEEEFTVECGIEVQTAHLNKWKKVLKNKVHKDLVTWAISTNGEAKTGYDIKRGNDLDNYIGNYHYHKKGILK